MSLRLRTLNAASGATDPCSKEGHSLTFIPSINSLILFGGQSELGANDLHIFDINQQAWHIQQTLGKAPSMRSYHTTFYDKEFDCLLVYGGQGEKGRSFDDIFSLRVQTWTWKKFFCLDIPPSRHQHSFCDTKTGTKEIVIFGGISLPQNQLLNDVWIFDYSEISMNSSLSSATGVQLESFFTQINGSLFRLFVQKEIITHQQATFVSRQTKGDIPSSRRGHSAFVFEKCMYVFGGKSKDSKQDDFNIFRLDLNTFLWNRIQTIGQSPTPRSFFSSSPLDNNRIINPIFKSPKAKLSITFKEEFHWSRPFLGDSSIDPRYNHSAVAIPFSEDSTSIAVLGGVSYGLLDMKLHILEDDQSTFKFAPKQQRQDTVKAPMIVTTSEFKSERNEDQHYQSQPEKSQKEQPIQFSIAQFFKQSNTTKNQPQNQSANTPITTTNLFTNNLTQAQPNQPSQHSASNIKNTHNSNSDTNSESSRDNSSQSASFSFKPTGFASQSSSYSSSSSFQQQSLENKNQLNFRDDATRESFKDFQNEIDELEELIRQEEATEAQLAQEISNLEQITDRFESKCSSKDKAVAEEQIQQLDAIYAKQLAHCTSMFLLVKEEEHYTKSVTFISDKLERLLQCQAQYSMLLDQIFSQIPFDEDEPQSEREFIFEELLTTYREQVQPLKEHQRDNFITLHNTYSNLAHHVDVCQAQINQIKQDILKDNKHFESIFAEEDANESID